MIFKHRDHNRPNHSEALAIMGEVEGKHTLIVDDILDTGGSIVNAANLLKEKGARTVRVAVTHGLFSGSALERLSDTDITEIFVTDTIPHADEILSHPLIREVTVAPLLAEAIRRIKTGESISAGLIT